MRYEILQSLGQEFVSKIYFQEGLNSSVTSKFIKKVTNKISQLFDVGKSSVDVVVNQGEPYLSIKVDGNLVLSITNQYS